MCAVDLYFFCCVFGGGGGNVGIHLELWGFFWNCGENVITLC